MKQQFFTGDVVRIADTPLMDEWAGRVGTVTEVSEYHRSDQLEYVVDSEYCFDAKWLTIVERAWQKNTGEQPVEDGVEVEIKFRPCGKDKLLACKFRWDFQDSCGDIVEWRISDGLSSNVEQPEATAPSHVALGDNLVFLDSESTIQNKKHSHYFKKCGYDYVDVYRVLKMFDVTDPCISHACKKLLVSGGRGFKDIDHDIQDVIDTLVRWQEMRKEDSGEH